MRGGLDLTTHRLAGLYRPPTAASGHRRARLAKSENEMYRRLWRVVDGAVRDALATHPEYLTDAGRQAAQRSITKRVTGALSGFAAQAAKGPGVAESPRPVADSANPISYLGRATAWVGNALRRWLGANSATKIQQTKGR